jgi:hypothetical protein
MDEITAAEEIQGAIAWCHEQAEGIMAISAGCASEHGDRYGALQHINSMASDIAINLETLAEKFAPSITPDTPTGGEQ